MVVSPSSLKLKEEHVEQCAERLLHRHGLIGGWLALISLVLFIWSNAEGRWMVQNEVSQGWDPACENRFSLWSNTKCRQVDGAKFGECKEECEENSYVDILSGKIVFGELNTNHFILAETFQVLAILQSFIGLYCLWKPGGRWGTVASTVALFFASICSVVVIALVEDSWVYRNNIFGCFEDVAGETGPDNSTVLEYCSVRGPSEFTMLAGSITSFISFGVLVHACRDAWRDDSPHTIRQLLKARDIAVSGVDLDEANTPPSLEFPKLSL